MPLNQKANSHLILGHAYSRRQHVLSQDARDICHEDIIYSAVREASNTLCGVGRREERTKMSNAKKAEGAGGESFSR